MSATYDRWRLPQLLEMVEADTDEATTAHLLAWREKCALLDHHKGRLTELVQELSGHWDPARSEAAQMLVNTLTNMIEILDSGSAKAATTHVALQGITGAIRDARKQLRMLASQYNDKAAATRELNKLSVPFVPDDFVPATPMIPWFGFDSIALARHQDSLDRQARAIMSSTDADVNEAASTFEPFPALKRYADGAVYEPEGGGHTTGSAGSTSTAGRRMPETPIFTPPPPSVAVGDDPYPAGSVPGDSGPVLAGGPVAAPATTTPPTRSLSPGAAPPPLTTWVANFGPGESAMPPGGVIGETGPNGRPLRRASTPGDEVVGGRGRQGETSSRGSAPLPSAGRDTNRGRARGRPRIVDRGVIAPDSGITERASRGAWQDPSYERYAASRRARTAADPDNPWHVESGVPPILDSPPPPGDQTAGPGVIGIDR